MCEVQLLKKYDRLLEIIRSYGSGAVAFSGGVDSTFLLRAAKEALGDDVTAITAASGLFPQRETEETEALCRRIGVRQIRLTIDEMEIDGVRENPPDRCYHCKKHLFSKILETAEEMGLTEVMEGSNTDDAQDYRPGSRAIRELGVRSPLKEAGFSKSEIRVLSGHQGLPTWNKPSFACLASRIPYGDEITKEKLSMAEQGEELLRQLGFRQYRVRIHGSLARIEIEPEEFERIMEHDMRNAVCQRLREIGFAYVSLDLQGYRTGSMNETLESGPEQERKLIKEAVTEEKMSLSGEEKTV